jgi:hypothetical protein
MAPINQLLQSCALSFGQDLNTAIRAIAHPAS